VSPAFAGNAAAPFAATAAPDFISISEGIFMITAKGK
jgi:hypothetical protein